MSEDELLALAKKAIDQSDPYRPFECATTPSDIIALIERHRAEVERLTRERDEARTDQAIANNLARSELQKREAAEAALATAQKRIAELEAIVEAADRVMIECGFMEGESWGGHPQDGISIASDLYIEKRGAAIRAGGGR